MKTSSLFALLFSGILLSGCSTVSTRSAKGRQLDTSVNALCEWTGLKRAGPITDIEHSGTEDDGMYYLKLRLDADGRVDDYELTQDGKGNPYRLATDPFSLGEMKKGLGEDDVKAPASREMCIAAVKKLNKHLQWSLYKGPTILHFRNDFVVTYETVPERELKKGMFLDPYVSFIVTPKGTIWAIFFGA